MEYTEACALANDLLTTLSSFPVPDSKIEQYAEVIIGWRNLERAAAALQNVKLGWQDPRNLPLPFHLQEAYAALRDRYEPLALPLPDLPPEEVEANRARFEALTRRYALKGVDDLGEWSDPVERV